MRRRRSLPREIARCGVPRRPFAESFEKSFPPDAKQDHEIHRRLPQGLNYGNSRDEGLPSSSSRRSASIYWNAASHSCQPRSAMGYRSERGLLDPVRRESGVLGGRQERLTDMRSCVIIVEAGIF